jgi:hypothetical protein
MDRAAVFVDAGYLLAAGSAALAGSNQPRHRLILDAAKVTAELRDYATNTTGLPLLRIYWYDGVSARGPSDEHVRVGTMQDVKLRLGFINSSGQQKGVDSLIVTDLIESARNHAMSDAVLVAGDEDTRIGVQIAQSYGVRVHLLGVFPARSNQSKQLVQEADTTGEWSKDIVERFLQITAGLSAPAFAAPIVDTSARIATPVPLMPACLTLEDCARNVAAALDIRQVHIVIEHWQDYNAIPKEFDGRLLAISRDGVGHILDGLEKGMLRRAFIAAIEARAQSEGEA